MNKEPKCYNVALNAANQNHYKSRNRMPAKMSAPRHPHPSHAAHASQPLFSLLGSSIGGRLTIAATVCALLWAVILWALT